MINQNTFIDLTQEIFKIHATLLTPNTLHITNTEHKNKLINIITDDYSILDQLINIIADDYSILGQLINIITGDYSILGQIMFSNSKGTKSYNYFWIAESVEKELSKMLINDVNEWLTETAYNFVWECIEKI